MGGGARRSVVQSLHAPHAFHLRWPEWCFSAYLKISANQLSADATGADVDHNCANSTSFQPLLAPTFTSTGCCAGLARASATAATPSQSACAHGAGTVKTSPVSPHAYIHHRRMRWCAALPKRRRFEEFFLVRLPICSWGTNEDGRQRRPNQCVYIQSTEV